MREKTVERNHVRTIHSQTRGKATVQVNRAALAITLFACASIAILTLLLVSGTVKTKAASANPSYKYYTSIQLEQGDTLWNIANTYMTDEYHNINEYIDEVCSINHISQEEIHAGQYLTIPYYSSDYLE
jgi:hypothetical protein